AGSSTRRSPTTTSCRSASTGSCSCRDERQRTGRELAAVAAPADDRRRLPPAEGGVPRHLHLEDPLPRRPGPADAEANAGGLPPVRRGGRRPAADDPAPATRRVPAAACHPPGARLAAREGAAAEAAGAGGGGAGARPGRAVRP